MATKTLTKEQWTKVIEQFKHYSDFNRVVFLIDGYTVSLSHTIISKKVKILIFINGKFSFSDNELNKKFCPCREKFVHTKKTRADILKILGKRKYALEKEIWDKKISHYDWLFNSIQEAKRVFEKNCDSIELIENSKANYHL